MRRLLRIAIALIIVNGLAAVIVWACGPDYTPLPTVMAMKPADDAAFDRGEIGVIRPRFRRATLAMSYRVFNNRPPLRVTYPWAPTPSPSPEDEWRKIRETMLGPATGVPGRKRRITDYVTPINCLEDAFVTAVRTFVERRQQYGDDSAQLKAWVSAQAAVFANCDDEPLLLPEPAANTADALTKADRAYQTAAAYFYAMQYDESARRFRAIAEDASSPWRPYGRYLAARSILRTATMAADSADQKPGTLAAAEKELHAVIADPIAAPVHASARGLLTFVGIRLRPFEELRSLSARIASTPDEMSASALEDLTYLLDHQIGDTVNYDGTRIPELERLRASHDLVDWIVTMQGREPSARVRAIARWQETRSMPWLVAALSRLRGADDAADALLDAAAAVPASSPSFATVSFLRVRLLIDLGRLDAARKVLAGLPDAAGPQVLPETINLYRGERLMVASTLEEFLKAAPRLSLAYSTWFGVDLKPLISFDEDAGVALDQRWPLDRLIDAGLSETLPARLRTRVVVAAFTRAIVLNRHDAARRIVPALRTLAPDLAADLNRYMRETTDAGRTRAAVLLILRTPGMTTDVRGLDDYYSWNKIEPRRDFQSFVPTWWCGKYPGVNQPARGEAASELIHELYVDHIVPYPSFITTAERAAVEQELAALDASGHATKYLATAALDWARERPTDPEAAEALARIVAGWRRACRNADDAELSRRSFQVLHKQFPKSDWAERTKYWYR